MVYYNRTAKKTIFKEDYIDSVCAVAVEHNVRIPVTPAKSDTAAKKKVAFVPASEPVERSAFDDDPYLDDEVVADID